MCHVWEGGGGGACQLTMYHTARTLAHKLTASRDVSPLVSPSHLRTYTQTRKQIAHHCQNGSPFNLHHNDKQGTLAPPPTYTQTNEQATRHCQNSFSSHLMNKQRSLPHLRPTSYLSLSPSPPSAHPHIHKTRGKCLRCSDIGGFPTYTRLSKG